MVGIEEVDTLTYRLSGLLSNTVLISTSSHLLVLLLDSF